MVLSAARYMVSSPLSPIHVATASNDSTARNDNASRVLMRTLPTMRAINLSTTPERDVLRAVLDTNLPALNDFAWRIRAGYGSNTVFTDASTLDFSM